MNAWDQETVGDRAALDLHFENTGSRTARKDEIRSRIRMARWERRRQTWPPVWTTGRAER
jgi:hypothetical protein